MASAGPRFFGFVVGGALPAATAADMLAAGWDQNAFNAVLSPAAAAAEEAAGGWLKDLLGIPVGASVGFVTGAQAANTVGLAAGRHHVLAESGWDVERDGLVGGPRVRVVASAERHATIDRSLRLLGLGTEVGRAGARGRQRCASISPTSRGCWPPGRPGRRSSACRPATSTPVPATTCGRRSALARRHGAWVHVDGAFGLWAAASPRAARTWSTASSWPTRGRATGTSGSTSRTTAGFVFCSRPDVHAAAAVVHRRVPGRLGRESRGWPTSPSSRRGGPAASRCGRHCASWARTGSPTSSTAAARWPGGSPTGWRRAAARSSTRWCSTRCWSGSAPTTGPTGWSAAVQQDGTCWLGGTTWQGRRLLRVSVSNHATTEADVDRSVEAVLRVADRV